MPLKAPRWIVVAAALSATMTSAANAAEPPVRVAAAASVKPALSELVSVYAARVPDRQITLTFGASGQLATQIENGAPFDVFLSADEQQVTRLAKAGLTVDGGALYALGPLAIFAADNSTVQVDGELAGLKDAVASGRLNKLAIANPQSAPYGQAARATLERLGLWTAVEPKLVVGENIAQALVFATSGGADAALVSASLLVGSPDRLGGRYAILSATIAPPLRQRLAIMKSAAAGARAFVEFILSDDGQTILRKYGFSSPNRP